MALDRPPWRLLVHALDAHAAIAAVVHLTVNLDLGVAALEVELAHSQRQDDFGLEHGQLLADAVAGPLFERPPGVFVDGWRVVGAVRGQAGEEFGELGGRGRHEALGDEVEGPREVFFVAVDGVRGGPDFAAG